MIRVGDQIPIQIQLFDGATGKFPRAVVRDDAGATISGSPFSLTHVALGQYSNTAAVMPATAYVTVQIAVYNDAGFTTLSADHEITLDQFDLDESNTVAPDNASIGTILTRTDVATSTRAPAATAVSTADLTPTRAANLDNLDVAVSTRLAAAGYTAPANSDITAIKAKTDNLPASPANEVTVSAVNTKLGTPEVDVSADIKVVKGLTIAGL